MTRKEDIFEFIRQNRLWLKEYFHIRKIAVFGSFVRNEQTDNSDIDLLIEMEDNTPHIYEKKEELRQYFRSRFNRNVDIAREKYLKPYVKQQIIQESVYVD
jgi:predicted nucleotidyltransferase